MREARCGPRPYANARAARLGPPRRPQRRRAILACRRRERAAADGRRPRADRGRRRVDRRDAGSRSAASPTRGSWCSATSEQLGLAASLNRGLDAGAGRYVARLDADDVALPERLESQTQRGSARLRPSPSSAAASSISTATGRPGTPAPQPARARCRALARPLRRRRSSIRRCSSIASCSTSTASLRPGLSRERGLRPLDAAARARRRRESRRAARAQARPPGAGVAAPQRRPGVLPAPGRAARDRPPRARARPKEAELAWRLGSGRGSGRSEAAGPFRTCSLPSSAVTASTARCARPRRECSCARMPAAGSPSAPPIRHGSPPVGSDGDGKSGRRGSARPPGSSSSPPRRARCASRSSLRSRRRTGRRSSIGSPLGPRSSSP